MIEQKQLENEELSLAMKEALEKHRSQQNGMGEAWLLPALAIAVISVLHWLSMDYLTSQRQIREEGQKLQSSSVANEYQDPELSID